MTVNIYKECLETALNDQTIGEAIQNRERDELALVEIKKTLTGYRPNEKGFHVSTVTIIFNYDTNNSTIYREDIIVDLEHRYRIEDGQGKVAIIGSSPASIYPH